MIHSNDVLSFWFSDASCENEDVTPNFARWFGRDTNFDRLIVDKFEADIERAGRGELDGWRATARGRLALIILLDQFPRNAFRGSAEAFSFDNRAVKLCLEGLAEGANRELAPIERLFFYLPLLHSEESACQVRSVACFRQLTTEHGRANANLGKWLRLARRQRLLIALFGRFPHRNAILERRSTPAERAFLFASDLVRRAHTRRARVFGRI